MKLAGMLANLKIRSFAVIEELDASFGPGFNVLTGETGAGKSIIIEALNLLLGGRGHSDLIRTGSNEAVVEGRFSPVPETAAARLEKAGVEPGQDLLIRRLIARDGRNRIYVNSAHSTLATIEEIARGLVDISGQREHISLLRQENQVEILDAFAGLANLRSETATAFGRYAALADEYRRLLSAESEREARLDYLSFWLREIEQAQPREGEDEQLQAERRILVNAEKLHDAVSFCADRLYSSEDSAGMLLGSVISRLREAASVDPKLSEQQQALQAALSLVEEAGRELDGYCRQIRFDSERLSQVEERLQALAALSRKHGGSLQALLRKTDEMRAELAALKKSTERRSEVAAELKSALEAMDSISRQLSAERAKAARKFERAIARELSHLAMEKAAFEVGISAPQKPSLAQGKPLPDRDIYTARGIDQVEFLISPNPGEEPRSLVRIASGGELSRVMLAVKRVLMERDPVPTYVFDEVDAGISGRVAGVVGRTIAELGRRHQAICITHLPQIAVFAEDHYMVTKEERGGRVFSSIRRVAGSERVRAVAAMLEAAGTRLESEALAQKMLAEAESRSKKFT